MKAKYKQTGNDCLIYYQVICVDNIVVTVKSYYSGWFDEEPNATPKVCITNAEARRIFYNTCIEFEKAGYECIYKGEL